MTIFKPEDFEPFYMDKKQLSDHASRILTEWIEKNGVRVYGHYCDETPDSDFCCNKSKNSWDTHQAILINIEEIEKKPCEHDPTVNYAFGIAETMKPICRKCGVKLKATWSSADE